MSPFSKPLPDFVRHTYRFDARSAVLDGFYVGSVFQLLTYVGRKTAHLGDGQHNLLMAALHVGLLVTPLLQAVAPMRRKEFVLATWVASRCSCLLLLLPYFQSGWPFAILGAWILAGSVLRIPAHVGILRTNYPVEIRNRVLSHVRIYQMLVTVPTALLVGFMIDYRESYYWPLVVLAASLSLAGAWQYSFIRPEGETGNGARQALVPLSAVWGILRNDRQFFWYEVLFTLGGIPNLWSLPLYVRFIADAPDAGGLGASWLQIAIMTGVLQPIIMALSLRQWGRLLDRVANPILQRAIVCVFFALHPLCFAMANSIAWAYAAYAVYGFVIAGSMLNWTLGSLSFGRQEQATAYSSIHTMLTGCRGIIAPWVGTLLCGAIGLKPTFVLASATMFASSVFLLVLHARTKGTWVPSRT